VDNNNPAGIYRLAFLFAATRQETVPRIEEVCMIATKVVLADGSKALYFEGF
jgi:hypothetical protein